jgi:response regulator RpfG family c-di-GMP phosphodiesterase
MQSGAGKGITGREPVESVTQVPEGGAPRKMNEKNDAILFRAGGAKSGADHGNRPVAATEHRPWRILVVDDDPDVHRVTRYALKDVTVEGKPLLIFAAYSAEEGYEVLTREHDIGLVLLDVVMEAEDAGLRLIRRIRGELGNQAIRIVLRTGQPGSAPEREVVASYDINDYKEKSELTANKLYTLVHAALRSYRDIRALERNRIGLEKIIDATAEMFEPRSLDRFASGVFEQVTALLHLDHDAVFAAGDRRLLTRLSNGKLRIVAAAGGYSPLVGQFVDDVLPEAMTASLKRCQETRRSHFENGTLTVYCPSNADECNIVHFEGVEGFDAAHMALIDVFARNIGIALHNLLLRIEGETNQREVSLVLGETIEVRSRETGNHVRRVAKTARLLAEALALSERELDLLEMAAPLHDIGKIAIPDAILDKPGALDDEERRVMRTHSEIGRKLLSRQNRPVFQVAALIAHEHHEKWDGTGYPRGLSGTGISVYGRIVAVADVFDALLSPRCYKEAWPVDRVVDYMATERGRHFDPALIDILVQRLDEFLAVRAAYPDPPAVP